MEKQIVPVPVANESLPTGFKLRHQLRGHYNLIYDLSWSPDGRILASASADRSVRLWNVQYGRLLGEPIGHPDYVYSVAWSPDGRILATGSHDETIRLADGNTGKSFQALKGHSGPVYDLAWSPDGNLIASASYDRTVRLWRCHEDWTSTNLAGHQDWVMSVAWSPDGRLLASASDDQTIRLWEARSGRLQSVLEGHTGFVLDVSFSPDGSFLASKSRDGSVRLWRCDTWEMVANLREPMVSDFNHGLAFHPHQPLLATLGAGERNVRLWRLDDVTLLGPESASDAWHYRNAKVVLVGDAGVGKSGLGLVLSGRPWVPTGSTHGCRVWTFANEDVDLADGRQETRETLLWDLAGQPGYRLTNQLHLNEVSVALVVFDASNEEQPLAGVRHWDRALRQAVRRQGDAALPLRKYLVAARLDRGNIPMWHSRIRTLVREMDFDGYFETSAKEGWQISELAQAIEEGIDWEVLPRVSSNELFQTIKRFFLEEKKAGRILSTTDDLYRLFCQSHPDLTADDLRARFDTCLSRMENRALVRRLRFGQYVLLQPELLDAYASDLVYAAQTAVDGLGTITEADALNGRFIREQHQYLAEEAQQHLLLIATGEELVRHEIVLKEPTEEGTDLIFPSQFTRERPSMPEIPGETVRFRFEGPVLNVYAVLVVRLAHSQLFNKSEMWKNAATFTATVGGTCGLYLRELDEGQGELTLFFDDAATEATRYQFENYVSVHLERRALPDSIQRQRLYACAACGVPVTETQVQARRQRGHTHLNCPVCDTPVSLLDQEQRLSEPVISAVAEMDKAADAQRDRALADLILRGKVSTNDYDVFLCYNRVDETAVLALAEALQERGVLPLSTPQGEAGSPPDLDKIRAVAVCVGRSKVPWQHPDIVKQLQKFVSEGRGPFILVAMPGCPAQTTFPEGILQVDWRRQEAEALDLLASLIISTPKADLKSH